MLRYVSNGTKWVLAGDVQYPRFVSDGKTWNPVNPTEAPDGEFETITDVLTLPNIAAYFDARDPSATGTQPANKANLTTWKDRSTNAHTLTVTDPISGATQTVTPIYRRGVTPFVRFNGSATRLMKNGNILNTGGGHSIYVVARSGALGYGTIVNQGSSTSSIPCYGVVYASSGHAQYFRRTNDSKLASTTKFATANDWKVFSVSSIDYTDANLRVNEETSTAGAASGSTDGLATTTHFTIGARVSPTTDKIGKYDIPLNGDVAAVLIFNEAHSMKRRRSIERKLAADYGLSLPSQGGSLQNPTAMLAHKQELTTEAGIPNGYPGFHNTGPTPGTVFTEYTGRFTTTAANQIIKNMYINGEIKVNHPNVTFQDCILYSTTDPKIDTRGTNSGQATFLRCEVFGKQDDGGTGFGYTRYLANQCFVHDCEDEFRMSVNVQVRNSFAYLQSNGYLTQTERLHTDCVQSNGGDNPDGQYSEVTNNTLLGIRHNLTKGNSAIILATEGASATAPDGTVYNVGSPLRHVRVDGNYLANGSYSIYIKTPSTAGSPGAMEDFTISNNIFRNDAQYGQIWMPKAVISNDFVTLTGNTREDGQALVIDNPPDAVTAPAPTEVTAAFNTSTRLASVTWKQPAIGDVTVTRTDNLGNTGSTTVKGLKSKYTFTAAIASNASSVTIKVSNAAGDMSSTVATT